MSARRGIVLGTVLLAASLGASMLGRMGLGPSRLAWVSAEVASAIDPEPAAALAKDPRAGQSVKVVGFGHVDVEEGIAPLSVAAVGRIAEILVQEGEVVKAGQPLVRLESESASAQLEKADAAVAEALVRLAQAQRAPENHRILVARQKEAIAADRARLEGQSRQVERLAKLRENDAIPAENFLSARDKLEELEAALRADELSLEQLNLDDPAEPIELAQTALAAAKAQRVMAADELARRTLTAPTDGVVLRVLASKGQAVGPNSLSPALWFCPDRPRIVRCEIDQEFADRVAVGMAADLFDDRHAGVSWTGKVIRCADWIAARRSLLDEPFQKNDVRTLECIVGLDEGQAVPRIGQRLRVRLYASKQSVGSEAISVSAAPPSDTGKAAREPAP